VAHEALHAVQIDALAQQLDRERVAQVVEADLERDRFRPQPATARAVDAIAAAVRRLLAGRAVARLGVASALLVLAPATAS
jgi:hypothetical protein